MTRPRCGNDPRAQLTEDDRRAVADFRAYLADRAALRDRIAEAIARRDGHDWGPGKDSLPSRVIERYTHLADAVLAVLPPPADRTAAPSAAVHEALRRWAYAAGHNEQGMDAAARRMYELVARDVLRRMADETATTETQPGCPTPETHNYGCGCPSDVAAAISSCPGYEMSPSPCRCPCYGCKHHCGAHNPNPDGLTAEQPAAGARQDGEQR